PGRGVGRSAARRARVPCDLERSATTLFGVRPRRATVGPTRPCGREMPERCLHRAARAVYPSVRPVGRGHPGRADHYPGCAPQGECILTKKLYVGNLPFDATADELREVFSAYGRVLSATIATDRETGTSRGFGFVELVEGAEEAIQALNQAKFGGRSL